MTELTLDEHTREEMLRDFTHLKEEMDAERFVAYAFVGIGKDGSLATGYASPEGAAHGLLNLGLDHVKQHLVDNVGRAFRQGFEVPIIGDGEDVPAGIEMEEPLELTEEEQGELEAGTLAGAEITGIDDPEMGEQA